MTGDAFGSQDGSSGLPRIPAQRHDADLVAPITGDCPRWQHRYVRAVRAVDAGAVGCAPVLYLLWRDIVPHPLVAVALSVVVLLVVGRWGLRMRLHQLRRRGRAMSMVLAVGDVDNVAALASRTLRSPQLGWRLTAACTPTGTGPGGARAIAGVEVVGDLDSVAAKALAGRYDAVAVTPTAGWTAVRLQQLAWDLDCSPTALLVDPRVVPMVDPRTQITGVDGLPLLRLEHPALRGVPRLVKGATDRLGALLALVLVAPVLLACAVAVRRDGGPVFRRRRRIGRGGRPFTLLTFRTTDATGTPTRVGRILRRHCLDELPQLFNVLGGSMALVGPRPLRPDDVRPAGRAAQRRMLVKPGITGLSQVDEPPFGGPAEGTDLRYVTQWTPALDARILAKTMRAVLSSANTNRTQR